MLSAVAAVVLFTLGGATCPLPDARAGTALNLESIRGFVVAPDEALLVRLAPVILVEAYEDTYNRIGAPAARFDKKGDEEIYVDPGRPVYYTQVQEWQGARGNLSYLDDNV